MRNFALIERAQDFSSRLLTPRRRYAVSSTFTQLLRILSASMAKLGRRRALSETPPY
jgi:hypothetical protein